MATTSRNLFQHLPPPAECLAILIGTAEVTIFGLAGFSNPSQWAEGFGIPTLPPSKTQQHPGAIEASSAEKDKDNKVQDAQKALIAACAARNIEKGILLLTLGLVVRDRKALGIATVLGVFTTATDYLVVKWYGVKEAAFGHVIGMMNSLLVGGSLLYWQRNDPWWWKA
ncbi:hypothetical protein E2P81_ATG00936 [Venturia nashicola]|uniref:Uncharacterized protein n=1 Tax=Venturia nashicola TaxID=86259 RepID=A0A4Z1PFM6_9PEZI|nr:hypothetical protein E6O75_ATG00957 [Venturia nashicola]TLD38393.1 hypothetical protein E2P81_ATG00936 [Venturia nashicola]